MRFGRSGSVDVHSGGLSVPPEAFPFVYVTPRHRSTLQCELLMSSPRRFSPPPALFRVRREAPIERAARATNAERDLMTR